MSRNLPISREDLYQLVWSKPMLRVAERFGVSSSYLARVCTSLNVPRPKRGYWAKLAAGKAMPIPKLPGAKLGEPLEWSKDRFPSHRISKDLQPLIPTKTIDKKVVVSKGGQHKLLRNSRTLYKKCRFTHDAGYLRPDKKILADIVVSEPHLERALACMNRLFLTLERRGHNVMLAPHGRGFSRASIDEKATPHNTSYYKNLWSPARCTIVYIGDIAIGLTLVELSEEIEMIYLDGRYIRKSEVNPETRRRIARSHTWETTKSVTNGRFRLQAYSPYPHADWSRIWEEKENLSFTKIIPDIVTTLEGMGNELLTLIKAGEIRSQLQRFSWEIEYEEHQRGWEKERRIKAKEESASQLLEIIAAWDETERIRRFFSKAERVTDSLGGQEKVNILERLQSARELIGDNDLVEIISSWKTPKEVLEAGKRNSFRY